MDTWREILEAMFLTSGTAFFLGGTCALIWTVNKLRKWF